MFSKNNIRALIDLLSSDPEGCFALRQQLALVIKSQPVQFREVISSDFGGALPAVVSDVLNNLHREGVLKQLDALFAKPNPDLLEGLVLINRFIDINIKEGEVLSQFNLLVSELAYSIDGSFDIFHKAEIFRTFLFEDFSFKLESLSGNDRLLCLADAVRRRKCSSLMMAALYITLAQKFDIEAFVSYAQGKPVVCFKDKLSLEPVFIDITAKGRFVSEEECHSYAAARGFDFDARNITAQSIRQVLRRLISNLIFVYSQGKNNSAAAAALRKYVKNS